MAFFRVSVGVVAKSDGGSVRRRSAYVRGTAFDEFNFLHKASELQDNGILLPAHANDDYLDPEVLWSSVEATETSINAVLGRTLEIAIPLEIPEDLHTKFATDMLQFIVDDYGLAVEWAIHKDWSEKLGRYTFHIHSTETTRGFDDDGLMTKKVNKDRKFKSLCSKSRATGGKILVRGVISEQMNTWMDVHGIEAEVTHEAHDDRDLIIPDMPFNVRKVYQRWQEAVKDAELENNPTPDCPYYVQKYLDEISAVEELRATQADLEKIRNQPDELSTWDKEVWETFNKPSPFISVVTTDVENTDDAIISTLSQRENNSGSRAGRYNEQTNEGPSNEVSSLLSWHLDRRRDDELTRHSREAERDNKTRRQSARSTIGKDRHAIRALSAINPRHSDSTRYHSSSITALEKIRRVKAANAVSSRLDALIDRIKIPTITIFEKIRRARASINVSNRLDALIDRISPAVRMITVTEKIRRIKAADAVSSRLDGLVDRTFNYKPPTRLAPGQSP